MKKAFIALIVLMLSMLACSMQDLSNLQAGINGSYTAPMSSASSAQDVIPETRSERKDELSNQDNQEDERYTVCTGNPTGNLRVRVAPGTSAAEASFLSEGTEITVLDQQVQEDGSTWAKIQSPTGWVNARYLCTKN